MITYDRLQCLLDFHDYRTYSGRNMMGRECLGVVTEDGMSAIKLLSQIVTGCDDVEEASELLRLALTDSMGCETIVYWPSIRIPEKAD